MSGHPLGDWVEEGAAGATDTDEEGDQPPRRRLRLLLAAAAALWLVAAGAFLLGGQGRESAEGATDDHPEPLTATDDGSSPAETQSPAGAGEQALPSLTGLMPDGQDALPPGIAAQAVVGLRLGVSQRAAGDAPARYVDVAIAEDGEQVGSLWVVRLIAVVLEGDGDQWTETHIRRFAVPVAVAADGDPTVAGPHWELPSHARAEAPDLGWTQDEEPEAGVEEALASAGYAGVTALATARSEHAPVLRATFEADAPAGHHEVWLSADPRPRVLGTSPGTLDTHDWRP